MTTNTLRNNRKDVASRRAFIGRAVATGGLAGAAAVAATATGPASATLATVGAPSGDDAKRYRESAHVSRYYSLARF